MARIARRFFQSKKKTQQLYSKRIRVPDKKRPVTVIVDGPDTPPPPPPKPSELGFAAKINYKSCIFQSKKRKFQPFSKRGLKPGEVFPSMPDSSSLPPPTK